MLHFTLCFVSECIWILHAFKILPKFTVSYVKVVGILGLLLAFSIGVVPGQEMSSGDVPFTANERLSGVLSTREHGPCKMLKYRNLRLFWCWPAEKRNKAPSVWTLQTSKFISFAEGCKEPHFPLGPCDCLWQIFNIPLMNGWLIEQEDWNQTLWKHTLSN